MGTFCIGEDDEEERPLIYKRIRRVSNPFSESVNRSRSWIVDDDDDDDDFIDCDDYGDVQNQQRERVPDDELEDSDFGSANDDQKQQTTNIEAFLTDTELFDCPICLDQLFTPLFQCDNGHIACSSCYSKLNNKCPFCCMRIDTRCRGLEKFIESIIISCKYAQTGCNKMIPYDDKINHEQICPHTTCFCPQPSCSFAGTARALYIHFDRQHPASVTRFTYNTPFSVSIELNQKQMYLQQQRGTVLFILHHQLQERGRTFYIDCVARDRLKNMFDYQLTVETDYSRISFQTVPEITTKSSKYMPTKAYLTVPSEFADNNGILNLSVCINKVGILSEIEPAEIDFWYEHDAHKALKVVLTDPNVLDCPSCLEPLSNPVFQCKKGHLVCSSCCPDSKSTCPSCGSNYLRCRGLDRVIVSISKISCQNAKNGCKAEPTYYRKSIHEKYCRYVTCFCPYPSCPFAGYYKSLYLHFGTQHSHVITRFTYETTFSLTVDINQEHMFLQEQQGRGSVFILNQEVQQHGRTFYLDCIGPTILSGHFLCEYSAKSMETSWSLKSAPKFYTKWVKHPPTRNYLTVPSEFAGCNGLLSLSICIKGEFGAFMTWTVFKDN